MDPKEEIAQLKTQVATLTTQVATAAVERDAAVKERDTVKNDNRKLVKDVADKNKLIDEKNDQIIGARKKFSEMSAKEKEELTEAEKAALQANEETNTRLAKLEEQRNEDAKRERDSRIEQAIGKYSNRPDIQAKIRENFANLKTAEKAMTIPEIEASVRVATDMLGALEPGALNQNVNAGNGDAPGDSNKKGDFADTPEGQAALARIMPSAVGALKEAPKAAPPAAVV